MLFRRTINYLSLLLFYIIKTVNHQFKKNVIKYISNFIKNKNSNNKKALIILDKDYNSENILKLLDIVLNEKNFTKIEINELEGHKCNKLKSLVEATQSQRLSTISDKLKEKCKLLKSIPTNSTSMNSENYKNN